MNTTIGEMKALDVRNWVLNNRFNNGNPSKNEICFSDMFEKNYLNGLPGWSNRTLNGVWLYTWEVEKLFTTFFEDGAWRFRAMECDVTTYVKDSCPIEPSVF